MQQIIQAVNEKRITHLLVTSDRERSQLFSFQKLDLTLTTKLNLEKHFVFWYMKYGKTCDWVRTNIS